MSNNIVSKFQFSIIDENTKLLSGSFHKIKGLSGNRRIIFDNEIYHQIQLIKVIPKGQLKEWCLCNHKEFRLRNFEIHVLNDYQTSIGTYYFAQGKPIQCRKYPDKTDEYDIVMIGRIYGVKKVGSSKIWKIFMKGKPEEKNLWAHFSFDEKKSLG